MATEVYLAMTAAEFTYTVPLPAKAAWMACHFSPYGQGLSNLPAALPEGSILILNDRIPVCNHDPEQIFRQLQQALNQFHCSSILLDFEQPNMEALGELAAYLTASLPCPVAVSDNYAASIDCPVFLCACPHHTPLSEHIAPWAGRELWLDLARDAESIVLTKQGASILPLPLGELPEKGHHDRNLHCHYKTQTGEDFARFTLWRTGEDLNALADEARELGISTMVGLYQEWHHL